ncbi:MAG: LmbE family protein [Clostridia bacterium]|nr:LmbE family protein [Clostridia bacterium]
MIKGKKMLVFSAHSADFVWRAGGTIAKYIKEGAEVKLVVLSFGVRGESNDLWKQEDQTTEKVKEIRKGEALEAASILGLKDIEFWDFEDYPIYFDRERLDRIVEKIRIVRPDIILTHDANDAFNPDHNKVHEAVFQASVTANSAGALYDGLKNTKQMRLFGFEPHQTEISNYVPGSFVDITSTYEQKISAMKCFKTQNHLIEYYTQRAFMRGNHARRISGISDYKYAESFANFFPVVGEELY